MSVPVLMAALALVAVPAGAVTREYPRVARAECFPVEQLPPADRQLALEWLQDALDREPLYTILGDLKPISSAARSFAFAVDEPDLEEIERARRIAAALRCGEGLTAHVHLFAASFNGHRHAQIIFVNRYALDTLLEAKREFFAPLGLSPGSPPLQVLGVVEHLPREARFRGLGYLFGYPDYAVDFFVAATREGAEVGPGKDREFYSVPVHRSETGYFVWAVPLGHEERAEDRRIAARAAPILDAYRARRPRFVGKDGPGPAELIRAWLCDDAGCTAAPGRRETGTLIFLPDTGKRGHSSFLAGPPTKKMSVPVSAGQKDECPRFAGQAGEPG